MGRLYFPHSELCCIEEGLSRMSAGQPRKSTEFGPGSHGRNHESRRFVVRSMLFRQYPQPQVELNARAVESTRHSRSAVHRSKLGLESLVTAHEEWSMVQPTKIRVSSRKGGAVLSILLWSTIAATVLLLVIPPLVNRSKREEGSGAEEASDMRSSKFNPTKLDPEPYRAQIVALEECLYRDSPAGFDDGDRVSELAAALSMTVRGDGRNRRRQLAFQKLFDYAGSVGARTDVGYTQPNLVELRNGWEELRESLFSDADWLRQSSAALTASQTPAAPDANPLVVRQLTQFAGELEGLIRSGRRAALAIPEAGVDAALGTRQAREAEQEWHDWSESWKRRLESAVRYGPRSIGSSPERNVTFAYQELQQVLRELRLVPMTAATTTTIPFKSERERHFESASHHLRSAREYLARIDS